MARTFDRFMVDVGIGTNRKVRRLPVAERWVYVAGILSLAAQSPMRGALLIADGEPATADDIAAQATVPVKHAHDTLQSLHRLGMLDEDTDGVLWVHDWDKINPEPKPSDSPAATRERKRRQREERRNSLSVTRDMSVTPPPGHAPEVEGEVEVEVGSTPKPPQAGAAISVVAPAKPNGSRTRDLASYHDQLGEWVSEHFPGCLPKSVSMVAGAVRADGREPTPDAIRQFAEAHPNFAALLQPQEAAA